LSELLGKKLENLWLCLFFTDDLLKILKGLQALKLAKYSLLEKLFITLSKKLYVYLFLMKSIFSTESVNLNTFQKSTKSWLLTYIH